MPEYKEIPKPSTWKSDSSVFMATRKSDIVLDRIDHLIAAYHKTIEAPLKFVYLSDIFMTADYWLKLLGMKQSGAKVHIDLETGREKPMWALYRCAAAQLRKTLGCTINGLPRELELMWGRSLSWCGVDVDMKKQCAEYISRSEAAKYRLWFRNGMAWMLPWWNTSGGDKPELANSRHAYDAKAMAKRIDAKDYGFFVLTMSRDLYMAKHRVFGGEGNPGFYHSSYVAGDSVQCSGTMLIEGGVVKRIRLNSGHYMPHESNLRALIMALRMWQVNCEAIVFEDFEGKLLNGTGKVKDIVDRTNTKFLLEKNRGQSIDDNKLAFNYGPQPDMANAKDPRTWWGNRPGKQEVAPPALRPNVL